MAYNITLTNGQNLVTVADGTTDTNFTSLTLIGKNFAGYGAFLNENYVKMLENFSNTSSPPNPLQGQLYWDSTNKILKVYNGTTWKSVSSSTSSLTAPALPVVGDLWWDTTNGQLKVWGGSQWIVIGPAYTATQGQTGVVAATVSDGAQSHIVVKFIVNNVVTAIFSKDPSFIVTGETGFTTINPGMTLATLAPNSLAYYGDANNALNLGGVSATNFMRKDQANTTSFPISISNNTGLTVGTTSDFNVGVTGSAVNLTGLTQAKDLNLYVNVGGVSSKLLSLNGTNGSVLLAADPTLSLGAATKQYVDNQVGGTLSPILLRDGSNTITGTITPGSNNVYNFGSGAAKFNTIYATNFSGLAVDSSSLGGSAAANYMRKDVASPMTVPLTINNNSGITLGTGSDFAVDVTSVPNAVNVRSKTAAKSMDLYVNLAGTPTIAASFSGTTGLGTVIANPTANLGIATKQYVDSQVTGSTVLIGALTGSLVPNANNVYNVGSSAAKWNTMYATTFSGNASTANYADLAERFEADAVYIPGTVVELGGVNEITAASTDLSENVFGVISTQAAYLMNASAGNNDTHPPIAMQGRVPVRVTGIVNKGDRLVSAGNGLARAASRSEITPYNVIGRSLVNKTTTGEGTVEAIVKLNS